MTTTVPPLGPFTAALGGVLDTAAPAVRRHLAIAGGHSLHQGVIRRMWRRGLLGALGGRLLHLDSGRTAGARFELRNELVADGHGDCAMIWERTHFIDGVPVPGVGLLRWDAARKVLVDEIGRRRWLEVELTPRLDGRAITMCSERQWLRVLGLRLPLPHLLVGGARTCEWEEPDGQLGLSLTLHHPLAGDYAGYEAILAAATS